MSTERIYRKDTCIVVTKDGCQNLAPAQIGVNGPIEVCN